MSLIKILQREVSHHVAGFFANWTPDKPLEIGEYGYIKKYVFTKDGSIIRDLGEAKTTESRSPTASLAMGHDVDIEVSPAVSGTAFTGHAKVKARIGLTFNSDDAFLYHLEDLTTLQFESRQDIFTKMAKAIFSGHMRWMDDYVLVTEIKKAGKVLVYGSNGHNQSMEIEAEVKDPASLNLASVAGSIGYKRKAVYVAQYEIDETRPALFRLVRFTITPPGGDSRGPISVLLAALKGIFGPNTPRPEGINLRRYTEETGWVKGEFEIQDYGTVTLWQETVDFASLEELSHRQDQLRGGPQVIHS